MNKVKLSKFVHLFKRDKTLALYHSVYLDTLYIPLEKLPFIENLKSGVKIDKIEDKELRELTEELFKRGDLIDISTDESVVLEVVRNQTEKSQKLGLMYLLPTDNCNFRCVYCFIRKSVHMMNEKTCDNAIEYFFNISDSKEKQIILYGGEPLLNWKICEMTIRKARAIDDRVGLQLVTNGSLITDKIAKLLADFDVETSISIDGPKEVNDAMRKDCEGNGTFDKTMLGYKALREYSKCGISCTVASHNINILPQVTEWIVTKLEPSSIGFNLLIGNRFTPIYVDPKKVAENLIKSFEICKEHGIYEDRVGRKVINWVKREVYPTDCAGIGGQIVVTPDGMIGPCHAFIGSDKYFSKEWNIKEDKNFQEFAKRYPFNMESCYECEALGICGGGCPYRAYLNHNTIWGLDEDHCEFVKHLLQWMIWESYDKTYL